MKNVKSTMPGSIIMDEKLIENQKNSLSVFYFYLKAHGRRLPLLFGDLESHRVSGFFEFETKGNDSRNSGNISDK